jgi:hypothetical protein
VWKLEHVVWKDQTTVRSCVSLWMLVCAYIGFLFLECLLFRGLGWFLVLRGEVLILVVLVSIVVVMKVSRNTCVKSGCTCIISYNLVCMCVGVLLYLRW